MDKDFAQKEELLRRLKRGSDVFRNPRIEAAFRAVDRKDFMHENYVVEAYEDYPLPIGHEQTISQPTTVAFMLEKLDPHPGDKVLDVGSGSGWTTALLAHMVDNKGKVTGLERLAALVQFGQENLKKYQFKNAEIRQVGDALGVPGEQFDRILVSASATDDMADELLEQLKVGGTLVIPIGETIFVLKKKEGNKIERQEFPGFMFVSLVKEKNKKE